MDVNIEIKVEGMDVIIQNMGRPETVARPIITAMRQSAAAIQREISDEAPRGADSRLANSIDFELEKRHPFPRWVKIGPTVAYGVAVARGTRPHFPPPGALERWVRLKLGIGDPQEASGVAFLIARKISQVGTEANAFHIRGRNNARAEVQRIWNRAADQIARGATRGG
jgi:hypothetical protein